MKETLILTAVTLAFGAGLATAAITVPGANGTSGVLNITEDTTIDLSLAADGQWDAANTVNGIYDAEKWAVVFQYSSVTVAEGATLTFSNHPSKAPVVWLVNGNVTIDGTVSLNGQNGADAPFLAKGGPGGFRGGMATFGSVGRSSAFGIGGGSGTYSAGNYATAGHRNSGSRIYGNPSLVPLIGGSGGTALDSRGGGGAGGGAILVAATGTVALNGVLRANGGNGYWNNNGRYSAGGSGGGIRILCDMLTGNGAVRATGGSGYDGGGGLGRIRIERAVNDNVLSVVPGPSVVPLDDGETALLWPPDLAPEIRVISIGGAAAPDDPRAAFGAAGADVAIPETDAAQIIIETTNVEQASQLKVRLTPRSNGQATEIEAAVDSVISNDPLVVRWIATLPVSVGFSAVQVQVVRP